MTISSNAFDRKNNLSMLVEKERLPSTKRTEKKDGHNYESNNFFLMEEPLPLNLVATLIIKLS